MTSTSRRAALLWIAPALLLVIGLMYVPQIGRAHV